MRGKRLSKKKRQHLQELNASLEQLAEERTHAIQMLQQDKRRLSLALRNVRRCRVSGPRLTRHQRQLMNILMRHQVSPEVLQRCAEGGYGIPSGTAAQQPCPSPDPPAFTTNFIPTQVGRCGKPAARTAAYLAQHYLSTARLVLQTQVSHRKLGMCRELFVNEQCLVPNPHRPGQSTTVRRQLRVVAKYLKSKTLGEAGLGWAGLGWQPDAQPPLPPQPPPHQPPQQQGRSSWGTALEGQMLAPPIASPQGPIALPDLRHMYQLALAAIATQGQAAPAQGSELGAATPAPGFTLRKRTTPSEGLPKTAAKRKGLVKAMGLVKRGVKANCAKVQKAREVTAQRRAAEAAGPIEIGAQAGVIAAEALAQADAGADEADVQLHQQQADLQHRELQLAHNQSMQQLQQQLQDLQRSELQRKEQQLADLVAQQGAALLQWEHQLTSWSITSGPY
ncbi:hypothetical protein QJQ45_003745 [Haematococcus lacustris]|nr:hypothetical protein QJQ45_003745 [Haematococcus lacustris]